MVSNSGQDPESCFFFPLLISKADLFTRICAYKKKESLISVGVLLEPCPKSTE